MSDGRQTAIYEEGLDQKVPPGPHETQDDLTVRGKEPAEYAADILTDQPGVACRICFSVFEQPPGDHCPSCGGDYRDGDWLRMPFDIAGRYECYRLLGRGAMGAVYLARDSKRRRKRGEQPPPLAVKLVQKVGGEAFRDKLREMFEHESGVATLLGRTELFVKVLAHESSGDPYLVMEYVAWPTLKGLYQTERPPLPTDTVVRLGLAILEATEIMHFYRIVHRDLKPSNLFAKRHPGERRFKIKIADLGVWTEDHDAHEEEGGGDGLFVGSLNYCSPEQMACKPVGARSDLFSIGCMLWEAATGRVPFVGQGPDLPAQIQDRKRAVREGLQQPESMSPLLYMVLERALKRDPQDRFPNARAMADALRVAGGMADRSPSRQWVGVEDRQEGDMAGIAGPAGAAGTTLRGRLESSYDISHMLGAGGTSRVYEAFQRSLDRRVALKMLNHNPPKGFSEPDWFTLFRVEAQAASRLDHPNQVHVIDFGYDAEDLPYVAREIVDGESLESRLKREGSLPEVEALAIISRVAGTLVEAHSKNIVHRNLKPGAVWLEPCPGAGEVVKVANYGMDLKDLHLLPTDYIFGTPRYMAPEQIRGQPPSKAADLYALGVLLYLSVADSPPYEYRTTRELLRAKLIGKALPLPARNQRGSISRGTRAVTNALLLADPTKRPSDTEEVYQWLDALLAGFEEDVPITRLEQLVMEA